jgi:hypothetical protein
MVDVLDDIFGFPVTSGGGGQVVCPRCGGKQDKTNRK